MLNIFICIGLLLVMDCIFIWEIECMKKSLSDSNNKLRDMIIDESRKGNETAEDLDNLRRQIEKYLFHFKFKIEEVKK